MIRRLIRYYRHHKHFYRPLRILEISFCRMNWAGDDTCCSIQSTDWFHLCAGVLCGETQLPDQRPYLLLTPDVYKSLQLILFAACPPICGFSVSKDPIYRTYLDCGCKVEWVGTGPSEGTHWWNLTLIRAPQRFYLQCCGLCFCKPTRKISTIKQLCLKH
jgi:hypothetical protein